jgi:DNA-binding response OmpR family regulator
MKRDEKILIVEDNPTIAEAIEQCGHSLEFQCDTATDGWDAIEKLESEHYAAIVIDADVPRHSGFGVLTYLREEVGDDLDNVIFMTSSDRDEVRRKMGERLNVVHKDDAVAEIVRVVGVIDHHE